MNRAPTRVLVVAASLLVAAASVLAVTASAQSGARANHRTRPFHLDEDMSPHAVPGPDRGLLHGHVLERRGDHGRHEDLLCPGRWSDLAGQRHHPLRRLGEHRDRPLRARFSTGLGQCTLSGGTGTLDGIHARVDVSYVGGYDWAWDGTYRFREDD